MDREERAIERLKTRLTKEKQAAEMDHERIDKLADTMSVAMEGHPLWMCALALADLFSGLLSESSGTDEECPEAGIAWHVMMSIFDHMHEEYHDDK